MFIAIINTTTTHSGLDLSRSAALAWIGVPSSDFHDFHHEKFICNFGVFGLLDMVHGTVGVRQIAASEKKL
eukprot:ANDGO_02183.mRNA.1 sterol desaturase